MPEFQIITRDAAQALNLKRYFTGRPCRRGHICERYVSVGTCVMCVNKNTPRLSSRHFMPARPIFFRHGTPIEIQAAFAYVEKNGWFDAAMAAVRADPKLRDDLTADLPHATRYMLREASGLPRGVAPWKTTAGNYVTAGTRTERVEPNPSTEVKSDD